MEVGWRPLLATLAARDDGGAGLPVEQLRSAARHAVAALPRHHRLHGVEVDDDPPVALIRLLVVVARVVGDVPVPDARIPR